MANNEMSCHGGSLSGFTLKVEPADLYRQSKEVEKDIKKINDKFADADKLVKETSSYWNGDASDSFRAAYEDYKDEINEIIARLTEHVADLSMMADIYDSNEKDIREIAEGLPSDVII